MNNVSSYKLMLSLLIGLLFSPITGYCAEQEPVIGFYEERDLELFSSMNQTHEGVINKLFKPSTPFGKQRLISIVRNPSTDLTLIKIRQQQLNILVNNPTLLKQLKQLLTKINEALSQSHFIQKEEDSVAQKAIESHYFESKMLKNLNKSSAALSARNMLKNLSFLIPIFDVVVLHLAFEYLTGKAACRHDHSPDDNLGHGHSHGAGGCNQSHDQDDHDKSPKASSIMETLRPFAEGAHGIVALMSLKEMAETAYDRNKIINEIYKKVAITRTCLQSMKDIGALMVRNGLSTEPFGSSNTLPDLCRKPTNTDQNGLLTLLNDDSIDIKSSLGFASLPGNTLIKFQQLKENSAELHELATSLGDLDALVAVAEWYVNTNTPKTPVSFVQFIEGSNTPLLKMKNFWNPGLNPENVVTNDFYMGMNGKPLKNMITGPNKAGKSVILKAIGLNIILAQTFGIAAAEQVEMTLFHKLLSYITVTDDITQDQSGLIAEVMHADSILQSVRNLQPNEFACALIDDTLFKGTTFERGQEIAYRFIKSLASFTNCGAFIATHSAALKNLEKEMSDLFKNYRLKVQADAQGKKYSTFQLEEGTSDQKSAFDIVESQGYNVTF